MWEFIYYIYMALVIMIGVLLVLDILRGRGNDRN
jgi:hypothetical protein